MFTGFNKVGVKDTPEFQKEIEGGGKNKGATDQDDAPKGYWDIFFKNSDNSVVSMLYQNRIHTRTDYNHLISYSYSRPAQFHYFNAERCHLLGGLYNYFSVMPYCN